MVEENFKIRLTETLQDGLILLFSVIVIPSPWLKKILKFDFLKRLRMAQFLHFYHNHTFTMAEENVEI